MPTNNPEENPRHLRSMIFTMLIVVVVGMGIGRILNAERVYEPTLYEGNWPKSSPPSLPTFSSNDRSRWATVRALVDHGTYQIGMRSKSVTLASPIVVLAATNPLDASAFLKGGYHARIESTKTVWQDEGWDPGWDTVDKAMDPDDLRFYSTKPPLLATLIAGLYWLLQFCFNWNFSDNVWEIVRVILILVNVLPFAIYLWLFGRLLEKHAFHNFTKLFVFAAACFATLVTPFLITLNNHTIATYFVLYAIVPALAIITAENKNSTSIFSWLLMGLSASFAACNELPAFAFVFGLGFVLLFHNWQRVLAIYLPGVIIPILAFFGTNYLAIGEWRPVYANFGGAWYLFEGSHWHGMKPGIDFASLYEDRWTYAFHVLVGHHGWFSLTPIWILSVAGMLFGMLPKRSNVTQSTDSVYTALPWYFHAANLLLSSIVIGFYLLKSDNYGGWTAGLRWLMWLSPLWLLSMIPFIDAICRWRFARGTCYALLVASVLSMSYPAWNPWRHPWLYRWMDSWNMIPYYEPVPEKYRQSQ